MRNYVGVFGALVVLPGWLCFKDPGSDVQPPPPPPPVSCNTPNDDAAASTSRVGLSAADAARFYHLSEGSEVFPLSWLQALRTAGGEPFLQNAERFGLLPDPEGPDNPHGLPVGMTSAQSIDTRLLGMEMIGFNCAACHVGELTSNGKTVRVIGAPNLFDSKAFYGELFATLTATAKDLPRLLRFLRELHAGPDSDDLAVAGVALSRATPEQPKLRRALLDAPKPASKELLRKIADPEALRSGAGLERALANRMEEIIREETSREPRLGAGLEVEPSEQPPRASPRPNLEPSGTRTRATPSSIRAPVRRSLPPPPRSARTSPRSTDTAPLSAPREAAPSDAIAAPQLATEPTWAGRIPTSRNAHPNYMDAFIGAELTGALEATAPSSPELSTLSTSERRVAVGEFLEEFTMSVRLLWARAKFLGSFARGDVEETPGGPGRVDAFMTAHNMIFLEDTPAPTTSPIDYPHLWGFAKLSWLHWDANTTSIVERNVGQALGLGAIYDPATLVSTVQIRNIHELEELAAKIVAPEWPFTEREITQEASGQRSRGEALFAEKCKGCHENAPERDIVVAAKEIKTDSSRADSFARTLRDGRPYFQALHATLTDIKAKAYEREGVTADEQKAFERGQPTSKWRATQGYAARPLAGIWASPPYLHNGSVRTLRELLEPAGERKPFSKGTRAFDVSAVGYCDSGSFRFDSARAGNGKGGHEGPEYGTELSAQDKDALVEYMKTL